MLGSHFSYRTNADFAHGVGTTAFLSDAMHDCTRASARLAKWNVLGGGTAGPIWRDPILDRDACKIVERNIRLSLRYVGRRIMNSI